MAMFKGFKPQGLQKIANRMGYTGSMQGFNNYLQQNPDKQNMMNMYNQRAMQMAQGGAVRRMQEGGIIGKFPMGNTIPGIFGSPVDIGKGEIKTLAIGEDDNNPQMPSPETTPIKNPNFTP